MSGDEMDTVHGRVIPTRLSWRSREVDEWFQHLDALYMSTRYNAEGRPKRGAFPTYRQRRNVRPRDEVHGAPVPGLPENFYDSDWLASLAEEDRIDLDVQPAISLEISDRLMQ